MDGGRTPSQQRSNVIRLPCVHGCEHGGRSKNVALLDVSIILTDIVDHR